MVLREKLKSIRMVKGEVMLTYLTRISQVKDELAAVGEVMLTYLTRISQVRRI